MKIVVQIDDIKFLNFKKDTSLYLINKALQRGYDVYIYNVNDIFSDNNQINARVQKITALNIDQKTINLEEKKTLSLELFDAVLIRQDPPYNMEYLTYCYMLKQIEDKVIMVNNTYSLINLPEKISILNFPTYIPNTLITKNTDVVTTFIKKHKKIVVKPLYSYSGKDVFFLEEGGENNKTILEYFVKEQMPFIAQEFIPEIVNGDKRLLFIDGKLEGTFIKKPAKGETRTNLAAGATPEICDLSTKEQELSQKLEEFFQKEDIFFAGVDVVEGYLLEINITSPTGLTIIEELSKKDIGKIFWDKLEKKIKK